MIKKYFTLLLLLPVICLWSCKKKAADTIADINKQYQKINSKLHDYTMKRVDDITSKGGGDIIGYYRDDEVKKVIAEHYYDSCRTFTETYFDDGYIIFILNQTYRYNRPQSYTKEKANAHGDSVWYDDKKTTLEISRYYFSGNNLVKWIDVDGKEITPGTPVFINTQYLLWAETKILLMQLKENNE